MVLRNFNVEFSHEEELILCCARTNLNTEIEDKISSLLEKDLDWSYIFDKASEHKLVPLLYLNLNKYSEYVPYKEFSDLERIFFIISKKNFILTGKLFEILNLLNSDGISAVPYKGPVLALSAYGDFALREFADLDIYVDGDNIFRAKELLNTKGYKPIYQLNESQIDFLVKFQHEFKLEHDKPKIYLELHWDFYINHHNNDPIFDKNYITEVKGNGFRFPTFAPEELILILSLHASGHLWEFLCWICDIAQVIKFNKRLDWDRVLNKADNISIKRILGVSLSLAKDLIGIDLPDGVLNEFENDKKVKSISWNIQKYLFTQAKYSFYKNAVSQIQLREKINDGIKDYLSYKLNPQTTDIANSTIPYSLYPLLYAKRMCNELKFIFK